VSIVLNTICLTMKWYEQSEDIERTLEIINYVFSGIFFIEAFIKITGSGPKIYFRDSWNRFDFLIATGSLVSIIISSQGTLTLKGALTLVRSVRLMRILRLLRRGGRSLYMIFNTFVITLHSLANIGGLLMLIIYIYAILGMATFGQTMRSDVLNDYLNFETFLNSFVSLFVIATGDSWNTLQAAYAIERQPNEDCIENPTY
jgi:Ion transport protein